MFFWNIQQLLYLLFLQKEVSETTFCRKTTLTKFQEVLKNNFLQKKQFYKVSRSFKNKFRGETVEKIKCYIYIRYVSLLLRRETCCFVEKKLFPKKLFRREKVVFESFQNFFWFKNHPTKTTFQKRCKKRKKKDAKKERSWIVTKEVFKRSFNFWRFVTVYKGSFSQAF